MKVGGGGGGAGKEKKQRDGLSVELLNTITRDEKGKLDWVGKKKKPDTTS